MAEFRFEIASDAPNIQHSIHRDGHDFELAMDGGVWRLSGTTHPNIAVTIGRRHRWQDALREALIYIEAATK